MHCRAQWKYHTLKKHDLGDTLFEILEGWGTSKYFGAALNNKFCRIQTLRGNWFGVMLTTAS
jgi:hypothetical protein